MLHSLIDRLPLGVRLLTATSALLLTVSCVATVASPPNYTACILSLYLIAFATLTLLCEFSPYGLNVLMGLCPPLGEYLFRGCLYVLIGLLPLGLDSLGFWSGLLMIISGLANMAVHLLLPLHPYTFYGRRRSQDPDDEEHAFNEEADAEVLGALH